MDLGGVNSGQDGDEEEVPAMPAVCEEFIRYLDKNEMQYMVETDQSIMLPVAGEAGYYWLRAHAKPQWELFQMIGWLPVRIPEGSLSAITEAVIQVNLRLPAGRFDLDSDSGQVHFVTAQKMTDDTLGEEMIGWMMFQTLKTLDTFVPAFCSIIFANEPPNDAIELAVAASRESESETD